MVRFLLACALAFASSAAIAQDRFVTVASTTSTDQSGLFGHLLPAFKRDSGIDVRVVALGTGQALDVGRRGDADVVFVHDQPAEEKFVADGFGVARIQVMYNDFVVIGPKADPARIAGLKDTDEALRRVRQAAAPFVSRGDNSGTHAAELRYWQSAGVDIATAKGAWYREVGQGMGPALNTASAMGAYILADRATWLNFRNRGDLAVLVEGDEKLFNQYGVILVRHATTKRELGQAFIDWLAGPKGQATIAEYKIGGEQLFFPNAVRTAR